MFFRNLLCSVGFRFMFVNGWLVIILRCVFVLVMMLFMYWLNSMLLMLLVFLV